MKKLILISCLLATTIIINAQQIDKNVQYDSFISSFIKSTHIAGLSVAVIENGKISFMKSYGVKSLVTNEPVTNESVFHTASVSKCFVAVAIHQLCERGKVNLDDPIIKFLTYFKMDDPRYKQITLKQILNHTSGIPDLPSNTNIWTNPDTDDDVAERYVKSLSGLSLVDEPGNAWHYSNIAYDILADVISKVSGKTFEDYMVENIFNPLDMKNSDFLLSRINPELRTSPHVLMRAIVPTIPQIYPYSREHAPSSTLTSNITDMSKWALTVLQKGEYQGKRIFTEDTYYKMIEPQVPINENQKMALGWFLESYKGLNIISHAGGDEGYRSYLAMVPDRSLGIILLCNSDYFSRSQLLNGLFDIWLGESPQVPNTPVSLILGQIYIKDGLIKAIEKYNELKSSNQQGFDMSNREIRRFAFRLFSNNYLDDALTVMKWYSEMFSHDANSYWLLGEIYRTKGEIDKAIEYHEKAVAIDPNSNDSANILKTLKEQKAKRNILGNTFVENVTKHIEYLTSFDHRQAGSKNERLASNYITEQFAQIGINPEIQPFEFESYEFSRTHLVISGKSYQILGLGIDPYKLKKVYKGNALLVDFNQNQVPFTQQEAQGKAIITNNWNSHFRLLKYKPELIIYLDSIEFENIKNQSNINYELKIRGNFGKYSSANIIGTIGNSNPGSKEIIISAHYDTYRTDNPGASDNASGVGVMLELARYFKLHESDLKCNIKFIAFGAEEIGFTGSRNYIDKNASSLRNCELIFNIDNVGGNAPIYLETDGGVSNTKGIKGELQLPSNYKLCSWEGINSCWKLILNDELRMIMSHSNHPKWLEYIVKSSCENLGYDYQTTQTLGSDQLMFAQAGIVASGISIRSSNSHTQTDKFDNINKMSLKKAGDIVLQVILEAEKSIVN
ncbi:MAG: M20/M25/M40 family metallo-hydrolase [Bacteroidetes bacterium]|nr:M20/M25/M40 family metallo-hydrolase [Bacteroidota bacterium]